MATRPDLARRQRQKAEAFAARDPRLDLSLVSIDVVARGADADSDDALAYVGEVLLRATTGGEWDRTDDGWPAITWAGRTFDLRGVTGDEARTLVTFAADPTEAMASRLWPRTRHRSWVTPVVTLFVVALFALLWLTFGGRAALVATAFGVGFLAMKRFSGR